MQGPEKRNRIWGGLQDCSVPSEILFKPWLHVLTGEDVVQAKGCIRQSL